VKGLGGGDPRCLREPLLLSQVIWAIQEGGLKGQVAKGSPPATPGTCALGTNPRWRSCQSRWAVATVPWVSRHDEPTGQPSAAVHPARSIRSSDAYDRLWGRVHGTEDGRLEGSRGAAGHTKRPPAPGKGQGGSRRPDEGSRRHRSCGCSRSAWGSTGQTKGRRRARGASVAPWKAGASLH
jgi:hypothetical protein